MRNQLEDFNKGLINDINIQTALLEALEWDDEKLLELNEYLTMQFTMNQTPAILLNNIKKQFNEAVQLILKQLFEEIYILNGYYLKPDGDDIEH